MPGNRPNTILFAGGGTGGHIFPNMAVAERWRELDVSAEVHFLVSQRPLDTELMREHDLPFSVLPAQSWTMQPWRWPRFVSHWRQSTTAVHELVKEKSIAVVVATGGFVSAPALWAARQSKIPIVLVNLDAVPGRANWLFARWAEKVYSAYATPRLKRYEHIGLPLARDKIGPDDSGKAKEQLGLDPNLPTVLVCGGSQGAQSINQMMIELVKQSRLCHALRSWQIYHLTGNKNTQEVRQAYERAGLKAKVESFRKQMGEVWRSTTVAISRAGAGSVAEAWANATPTIFLPYPYHKDQHQRFNAEPLTRTGAAVILHDLIDPKANATQIAGPLSNLMVNSAQREQMIVLMRRDVLPDGARVVAEWLRERLEAPLRGGR